MLWNLHKHKAVAGVAFMMQTVLNIWLDYSHLSGMQGQVH